MREDLPSRIRSLPTASPSAGLDERMNVLQHASAASERNALRSTSWRLAAVCAACVLVGFAAGYITPQPTRESSARTYETRAPQPPDRHIELILTRSPQPRPFDLSPRRPIIFGGETTVSTTVNTGEL